MVNKYDSKYLFCSNNIKDSSEKYVSPINVAIVYKIMSQYRKMSLHIKAKRLFQNGRLAKRANMVHKNLVLLRLVFRTAGEQIHMNRGSHQTLATQVPSNVLSSTAPSFLMYDFFFFLQ